MYEDKIEVTGKLKKLKYEQIAQEGRLNGWRVKILGSGCGLQSFSSSAVFMLKVFFFFNMVQRSQQKADFLA